MAKDNHKRIIKIIQGIFDEYCIDKCGVLPIEKEDTLKINDPNSKAVIDYVPDFVIKRNISKHTHYFIVFEVVEGQTDDKTMADISRLIALGDAVKKALFIVVGEDDDNIKFKETKFEKTKRISLTLVGAFKKRFMRKRNNKDIINLSVIEIPYSKEDSFIKSEIKKEIKQFLPKQTH